MYSGYILNNLKTKYLNTVPNSLFKIPKTENQLFLIYEIKTKINHLYIYIYIHIYFTVILE